MFQAAELDMEKSVERTCWAQILFKIEQSPKRDYITVLFNLDKLYVPWKSFHSMKTLHCCLAIKFTPMQAIKALLYWVAGVRIGKQTEWKTFIKLWTPLEEKNRKSILNIMSSS